VLNVAGPNDGSHLLLLRAKKSSGEAFGLADPTGSARNP
jgi:hypothetical protein